MQQQEMQRQVEIQRQQEETRMKKEMKKQQSVLKKQKQIELEKRAYEVKQQKEDIEKMRVELLKQQEELEKLQEIENQREYDLELIRIELEKETSPASSDGEDVSYVTQTLVSYRPSPLTVMAVPGSPVPRPPSVTCTTPAMTPAQLVPDLNESSMSLPPHLPSSSAPIPSNNSATFQTSSSNQTIEHFRSNSSLSHRPVTPIYPPPFPKFESSHQPCFSSSATPVPFVGSSANATPVPPFQQNGTSAFPVNGCSSLNGHTEVGANLAAGDGSGGGLMVEIQSQAGSTTASSSFCYQQTTTTNTALESGFIDVAPSKSVSAI